MVFFAFTVDTFAALETQLSQPQGLNHSGIYRLREIDPNLTGTGVKFAVVSRSITYLDGKPQNDYQPQANHNCFQDINFVFHDFASVEGQQTGVSAHSTAVCSILFGRDPNAYNQQVGGFSYEGAVPEAQADVYEFWYFLIDRVFPGKAPDANIITADVGFQFEDWWTRGIDAMAQRYGKTIVVGIGNGSKSYDPPLYPGAGSNIIGVGVVQSLNTGNPADGLSHFALVYPEYSSQGPTSDGRCKPDIVAPGNCLAAAADEPNLYKPTGDWSSFSTPIVAGAAGLVFEEASAEPDLQLATSAEGGNCVIKALLLNSATKLPYWHKGLLTKDDDHDVPLDLMQGAGMVNAVEAHNQLTAGRWIPGQCPPAGWDLNKLDFNETAKSYRFSVTEPANKTITATVVWNRNFADSYPFEHQSDKDADIRLELWALDSNDANNDYLLDYSDSRNDNVEHIYTAADANTTEYEIIVSYNIDPDIPPQTTGPYGLVWNVIPQAEKDETLMYDLNFDGSVNDYDVKVLLDNILASIEKPDSYLFGDINSDGVLDAADLNILLNYIDSIQKPAEPTASADASEIPR
jgi:hypothetical protein